MTEGREGPERPVLRTSPSPLSRPAQHRGLREKPAWAGTRDLARDPLLQLQLHSKIIFIVDDNRPLEVLQDLPGLTGVTARSHRTYMYSSSDQNYSSFEYLCGLYVQPKTMFGDAHRSTAGALGPCDFLTTVLHLLNQVF